MNQLKYFVKYAVLIVLFTIGIVLLFGEHESLIITALMKPVGIACFYLNHAVQKLIKI